MIGSESFVRIEVVVEFETKDDPIDSKDALRRPLK